MTVKRANKGVFKKKKRKRGGGLGQRFVIDYIKDPQKTYIRIFCTSPKPYTSIIKRMFSSKNDFPKSCCNKKHVKTHYYTPKSLHIEKLHCMHFE